MFLDAPDSGMAKRLRGASEKSNRAQRKVPFSLGNVFLLL